MLLSMIMHGCFFLKFTSSTHTAKPIRNVITSQHISISQCLLASCKIKKKTKFAFKVSKI